MVKVGEGSEQRERMLTRVSMLASESENICAE
jgi:hypothetical protein